MSKEAVQNTEKPEYDSNPFSLSFRGLGYFIDYAKGVFIALLVLGFFSFVFNFIPSPSTEENRQDSINSVNVDNDSHPEDIWRVNGSPLQSLLVLVAIVAGVLVVAVAFGSLFGALIMGTIAAAANSAIKQKTITLGESFRAMSSKFSVLYAGIFYSSCRIIGGYFLLIVPGIRAQLRYSALPFIIMNEDISASDAMEKSKMLYNNHLMEVFGISTVGSIIPVIGQAVSASGLALSYQQISAYHSAKLETPKTHWLNYIGLLFILLIFFLAVTAGVILANTL